MAGPGRPSYDPSNNNKKHKHATAAARVQINLKKALEEGPTCPIVLCVVLCSLLSELDERKKERGAGRETGKRASSALALVEPPSRYRAKLIYF